MHLGQIRYLRHHEIEHKKWDNCIDQAANSLPYPYSWYLNAMSPHWDGLVLGNYEAVMPLTWKRKWGIHYLHQPYYMQQLGVFALQMPDADLVSCFLGAIPPHFRYIDFYMNEKNFFALSPEFQALERQNYLLDLSQNYAAISKQYSRCVTRRLKLALTHYRIVDHPFEPDINVSFLAQRLQMNGKKLDPIYFQRLRVALSEANDRGMLKCHHVFDKEDKLSAVSAAICSKNRVINISGSALPEARQNGAMYLLLDTLIREYAETDNYLDFEGSMVPGIAAFYAQFGGKPVSYWQVLCNRLPWLLKKWRQT